jgi:hypothetical protein
MERSTVLLVLLVALLVGCPPSTLTPSITVTSNPQLLTISGSGFANVSPCANLALEGLPQPSSNVSIGQAQCSSGSFQNFNWQYSYVGNGCNPSSAQVTATVFATDTQGSNAGASESVSIGWGPNCALAGTCGQIGQSACPGGSCSPGAVNSGGTCVACGSAEGQPVCAGTPQCTGTDLHPNFQGGRVVCTWNCGHVQGATCPSSGLPFCEALPSTLTQPQSSCEVPLIGSNLSNGGIFTCYDHGMIDTAGTCTCVPNTLNTCPISTSIPKPPAPNQGVCTQGQFKDNNMMGC